MVAADWSFRQRQKFDIFHDFINQRGNERWERWCASVDELRDVTLQHYFLGRFFYIDQKWTVRGMVGVCGWVLLCNIFFFFTFFWISSWIFFDQIRSENWLLQFVALKMAFLVKIHQGNHYETKMCNAKDFNQKFYGIVEGSSYLYILMASAALRALSTASAGERLVVITCLQPIVFVFVFLYLSFCI